MDVAGDIVLIQQAIAAFNHCVDFGDGRGFAELFVPEGVLDMGHTVVTGQVALADFAAGVTDRVPNPRHVVTNTWVVVDGGSATARSYAQVFVTPVGGATTLKTSGRYEDELICVDASWRFVRRTFVTDVV